MGKHTVNYGKQVVGSEFTPILDALLSCKRVLIARDREEANSYIVVDSTAQVPYVTKSDNKAAYNPCDMLANLIASCQ